MVTNIVHFQGKIIRNGPLNAQRPSADIGQTDIRIYGLRVTRQGRERLARRLRTVAALEVEYGSREDRTTRGGPTTHTGRALCPPTLSEATVARYIDAEDTHVTHTRGRNTVH